MVKSVLRRIWHTLLILSIAFIIFFAMGMTVLRLFLPTLGQHAYVERVTSKLAHSPVVIGQVTTGWYGLQPCFYLSQVRIMDRSVHDTLLTIQHMTLQINLLSSLAHWQLMCKRLVVDGATLQFRRDKVGQFSGLLTQHDHASHPQAVQSALNWLLTQSDITLKHITLYGQFEFPTGERRELALKNLTLRIRNNFFGHHFATTFDWLGTTNTQIKIIADMTGGRENLKKADTDVYVVVNNISGNQLSFLKAFLPQLNPYAIQAVQGSFKAWLSFAQGKLKHSQVEYAIHRFQISKIDLRNAQGAIEWSRSDHHNTIHLDNKTGVIDHPALFKHPIFIGHVAADVAYFHSMQEWNIRASKIKIDNRVVTLNALLNVTRYRQNPISIECLGNFGVADLRNISALLPQKVDPSVLAWAQQAFIAGSLNQGTFSYRGSLVANATNQFDMSAHLNHLVLSYAPHWPVVQNADINIVVHNRVLTAFSQHLESVGNTIDRFTLSLPLKKAAILKVTLHTQSDLKQGWQYIERSPMHLAKTIAPLQFSGPMDLNMTLQLPLHKRSLTAVTTFGTIATHDGALDMPRWNLALTHINGTVAFHDKELNDDGRGLQALLFGKPMHIKIKTVTKPNSSIMEFNTQSRLSVADISEHFPLPLAQFFKGSSVFAADLVLHSPDTEGNDLHISTDLFGVASQGLPPPFAKKVSDTRNFKLDVTLRDKKPLYLRIDYANLASLALIYDKVLNGFKFRSGNIQLGTDQAVYLPTPGLIIQGYLAELDCLSWQKFLSPLFSAQRNQVTLNNPRVRLVSLHIGILKAYHAFFKDLFLTIQPIAQAFKIDVINSKMDGSVLIPKIPNQQWVADFKRLYLEKPSNQSSFDVNPAVLPPLKMNIAHFKLDEQSYSSVYLLTEHVADGLLIKNLSVQSQDGYLNTHGWWKNTGVEQQTGWSGALNTKDLGQLISPWEKDSILGGKGYAHFSLHWYGKPTHIDWHRADGVITFYFKNGSLLVMNRKTASEIGVGQLLNLLSVDALFKRLETHFKDVTQKGMWFDVFNGQLFLNQGIATAKVVNVSGPVVKIKAQGQLNLSDHTSNMTLYVVPQLTSSFPAIAGIFGGPLAGAVVWMANKLVGQEINKISASTYSVTGPWKHLKIAKN